MPDAWSGLGVRSDPFRGNQRTTAPRFLVETLPTVTVCFWHSLSARASVFSEASGSVNVCSWFRAMTTNETFTVTAVTRRGSDFCRPSGGCSDWCASCLLHAPFWFYGTRRFQPLQPLLFHTPVRQISTTAARRQKKRVTCVTLSKPHPRFKPGEEELYGSFNRLLDLVGIAA